MRGFAMKASEHRPKQRHHYGIWIDGSRAIICARDGRGSISTEEVRSGVEPHPRYAGEGTDKTGLFQHTLDHQKSRQGHLAQEMRIFLRRVAERLHDPSHVTLMGPGDARFELQKELERRKDFKELLLVNKAADKMTMEEFVRLVELDHVV